MEQYIHSGFQTIVFSKVFVIFMEGGRGSHNDNFVIFINVILYLGRVGLKANFGSVMISAG